MLLPSVHRFNPEPFRLTGQLSVVLTCVAVVGALAPSGFGADDDPAAEREFASTQSAILAGFEMPPPDQPEPTNAGQNVVHGHQILDQVYQVLESRAWSTIAEVGTAQDYARHMLHFRSGQRYGEARNRLLALLKKESLYDIEDDSPYYPVALLDYQREGLRFLSNQAQPIWDVDSGDAKSAYHAVQRKLAATASEFDFRHF